MGDMGPCWPNRYAPPIEHTGTFDPRAMRQRARARRRAARHNVRSIRFLRTMAVAEATAFLMLIGMGLLKHFDAGWWHQQFAGAKAWSDPLFIMGNLHGAIFTAYLISIFVFRRRVGWGPLMLLLVLLAGLTPGGGIMVERWALHPPTSH